MRSTTRSPRPSAWQDERAVLRGLCHGFASAESEEEAIAATPRWVCASLGVSDAGVRISIPDSGGRLRPARSDAALMEGGRKRSARRRQVFVSRRPMAHRLSSPAGSTLAMLPLVCRGECLGVLEVVADGDAIERRWDSLAAVASQLAIALHHLRRQNRLRGELVAVRKAVSVGRSMSAAGSTEAALRAAARFVSERFRAPVAVWCASDGSPDLALVDVRGVGSRKRRELRASLPMLPRGPQAAAPPHEAVAGQFARLLDGIDHAEVVDAGDAVMLVGVSTSQPTAPMGIVATMLEEALHRRSSTPTLSGSGRPHLGIAWTAHELRGPLLGVKAALELMLLDGGEVSDLDRDRLSRSLAELEHLAGLVDGLLAWGAGAQPLKRRSVDMVGLIDDVVRGCVSETGDERVVVHAPGSATARVDPVHLRTAIANVLRNALAFSRPETKVEVSIDARDGVVLLAIHNEGTPIPAGGPSLFDPFIRGDDGGRHPSGRGLGLFIARRVVEAHGGRIWFESGDEGTTFFIRLAAQRTSVK
jgi:nitrogen-specific signal transduction histidine kinase